jgi:hypothetical protein
LHLNEEPLLVPSLVVTEVCYLLEREAGPRVEAQFVRSLADGDFIAPCATQSAATRSIYLRSQRRRHGHRAVQTDPPTVTLGLPGAAVLAVGGYANELELLVLTRADYAYEAAA